MVNADNQEGYSLDTTSYTIYLLNLTINSIQIIEIKNKSLIG